MKTLMCNHCGLPIQIPKEYAHVKSVENNMCPRDKKKEEKKV